MKFVTRLTGRAERTIASARIVLAVFTLFAIWLDPSEPSRYAALTYGVLCGYVLYAVVVAAINWRTTRHNWFIHATHVADIVVFAYLLLLTHGPASPLFVYCVFSLFCGALRWGWRGALTTTVVVLSTYVGIGLYASRVEADDFELNRFIIRTVYLGVVSALLVYLGRHEDRMRQEIVQLARWPRSSGADPRQGTEELLRHAMSIVDATHGVLVWEHGEEPWLNLRWCGPSGTSITRHAPSQIPSAVVEELTDRTFLYPRHDGARIALLADGTSLAAADAIHPDVLRLLPGTTVSSAFRGEHTSGRVLFALRDTSSEALPLTAIVARELGASLEQLYASERARELAIGEERIRLARDLHDGVLQALTGVRLEIQNVARDVEPESERTRDRLLAIERAIALEQRELRSFIAGLKPSTTRTEQQSGTTARLYGLVERTERQWRLPVSLRVTPADLVLGEAAEQAVSLIINEAIANAAKHAHPSKVTVDVINSDDALQVVVADDGRGFPFQGRFEHERLAHERIGPVSLRERLTAMHGRLTIESSTGGSRVEMRIPLQRGAA